MPQEIIAREPYSAILEELSKEIPDDDESDALYLDGEASVYSNQKTDSETDTDVKENPIHTKNIVTQTKMCVSSIHSSSSLYYTIKNRGCCAEL
ncbi:hypothetical protein AVEN_261164-1 [Araneus ventricosus]|uniref:Uncharacterized protein n=1 Tax=Araneus ventricosus TaxID=182803 RepID=A0A4Y2FLS9_ARAVE|nr:hypothetical protein AVEN_261164-1 [Araneus ventricosus]